MRAVVAHEPGPPSVLRLEEDWPTPAPEVGRVLIRVRAFGLNRAELFTRQGHSPGVAFPRVLGIECVGTVEAAPGTDLRPGQTVFAMMEGMGRQFDGGYAEYCSVPARAAFPIETSLPWEQLGAIPEMVQTTAGSLDVGLDLQAGETLLIRGGTSSIGMTAAVLAKERGATVLATSRREARLQTLRDNGADHALVDGGSLIGSVRAIVPGGVDKVLELVGTVTLKDSLRCARTGGVVCMTGILGNAWALDGFQPMGDIPTGVRLTSYSGGAGDTSRGALQAFVDAVEAGTTALRIDRTFELHQLADAHRYMEDNRATGKLVVLVR